MTLDQLRIFVAVAERGHMTKAAELLGISQSAASAAIRALEEQHGVHLFNRVGRNIELAQTGHRFLPEAKAVLERAAAARNVLEHVSQTVTGSLSIAASLTIASYWLPRRLATFHEAYPAVRLSVSIGNTRQVEASVLDGTADLGLVEGRTESDILRRAKVDTDRLMLVVAASHPEIAETAPGRPDITGLRWIIREGGSGTREVLEDLARREGISLADLQVFLVLPSNEAVRQAVEAGAGATIISELVVGRAVAEGSLRSVPIELPKRDFAMITHRDRQASLAQMALKAHLGAETKRSGAS
ncbi:LysR family transcriptional regulator [Mesorhizobium sp. NZP2077]|uniref:LysR family transcriptional regulator n=1 Tax=Mesorhizobium sp. NZP2077 TaxID=2483404 RepID=UPI0015551C74|nr:LysR family transcriptional regulator [Mesorhizobium sp. NZP2077]QKC85864.1 LysR family transcriptional regulator [Mesorhizobium sp. NZP2077]QKD19859.1 LysR family transcriptional regulator [Mesorhizobium sp. NZP2077]